MVKRSVKPWQGAPVLRKLKNTLTRERFLFSMIINLLFLDKKFYIFYSFGVVLIFRKKNQNKPKSSTGTRAIKINQDCG